MAAAATKAASSADSAKSFLLQRVQPAMTGLIDGSLSTLAPIFAVALATHRPQYAFFAGLATAIGAGVSMAFSEGLSDTGELTGRGAKRDQLGHVGLRARRDQDHRGSLIVIGDQPPRELEATLLPE